MRPAAPGRIIAISVPGIMVSFGSLVIFTFGAFVKPLSERFGWSRGQISMAFTLAALMIAVFSPILGKLIDRIGVRTVLPVAVGFSRHTTSLKSFNQRSPGIRAPNGPSRRLSRYCGAW